MSTKNLFYLGAVILVLASIATYALLTRPHTPTPSDASAGDTAAVPPQTVEEHAQYFDITAQYPQTTPLKAAVGVSADDKAVGAMKSFVLDTIGQFKKDGRFDSLTPKDIEMMGFDQGRKLSLNITYLSAASPRTVSYMFTISEDTGGAHGNQFFDTFTFDMKTGLPLVLGDLFVPNTDYLGLISTKTAEALTKILAPYADARMIADGTKPTEDNFGNFFLDGSNLTFLFPPYQVAPYAAGPQTVAIPLETFAGMLKAEYRAR